MSQHHYSNYEDLVTLFTSLGAKLRDKLSGIELTQAEYDALTQQEKMDASKVYFIPSRTRIYYKNVLYGGGGGGGVDTSLIAEDFDSSLAYSVGDVVINNGSLYKFTSAHTADDPWDATEVIETSVIELIKNPIIPIDPVTEPTENGAIWITTAS